VNEVLLFLLISGEGSLSSVEWLPKKEKKSLTLPFASLTNQITQGYPTPALSPPTTTTTSIQAVLTVMSSLLLVIPCYFHLMFSSSKKNLWLGFVRLPFSSYIFSPPVKKVIRKVS
jgi:hypothetical protein